MSGPGERLSAIEPLDDKVARHLGRYHLVAFFCRPGMVVLDMPCGSGYGSTILRQQGVEYLGCDIDAPTIRRAHRMYGGPRSRYRTGLLQSPYSVYEGAFDIIACIEGVEHIDEESQIRMMMAFHSMLKPGGKLIISSPINPTGISGPSEHNPHHVHELTRFDFEHLLLGYFQPREIQLLTTSEVLTTGQQSECVYAICEKVADEM